MMTMLMMTMMRGDFGQWLSDERRLILFSAEIIVRDFHYRQSPIRHKQDLNLNSGFFEWSCAVLTTIPRRHIY